MESQLSRPADRRRYPTEIPYPDGVSIRMANLITNKHKKQEHGERPTTYTKRLSARHIRRSANVTIDDDAGPLPHRPSKHAKRKRSGRCPVCTAKLAKNERGTRYIRKCSQCRSQFLPDIRCDRCATFRVWGGPRGYRCKGCGNPVQFNGTDTPQNDSDGG